MWAHHAYRSSGIIVRQLGCLVNVRCRILEAWLANHKCHEVVVETYKIWQGGILAIECHCARLLLNSHAHTRLGRCVVPREPTGKSSSSELQVQACQEKLRCCQCSKSDSRRYPLTYGVLCGEQALSRLASFPLPTCTCQRRHSWGGSFPLNAYGSEWGPASRVSCLQFVQGPSFTDDKLHSISGGGIKGLLLIVGTVSIIGCNVALILQSKHCLQHLLAELLSECRHMPRPATRTDRETVRRLLYCVVVWKRSLLSETGLAEHNV